MDSTEKPFTAVEWCAGYAGIHLGLKRVIPNLRVIAFSEIEAFACANLVAKMEAGLLDPAPIWPNLKTFPSAAFANKVDLLVAGYPCQPFSAAGKRLGTEDERHLWPHIANGIRAMRPRFCFFENVEGHITLGLSTVISDLAEMGYKTTWGVFSASEVGAPHQRKRVFILAYDREQGLEGLRGDVSNRGESRWDDPKESGSTAPGSLCGWKRVVFAAEIDEDTDECPQCGYDYTECDCPGPTQDGIEYCEWDGVLYGRPERQQAWPSRPGQSQYEWEPPRTTRNKTGLECAMGRDAHGSTDRLDNAKLYGTDSDRGDAKEHGREELVYAGRIGQEECEQQAARFEQPSLYTSCDNRVDELRLLGNGVVPATAARAWEVLWARLNNC